MQRLLQILHVAMVNRLLVNYEASKKPPRNILVSARLLSDSVQNHLLT